MLYGLLLVVQVVVLVYCALDVVRTPKDRVRVLPKALWLVLIVLFPLLGGAGWFVLGRPQGPPQGAVPPPPPAKPVHPDDDEDFLRHLRERAEEQRRRAQEQDPPA